MSGFDPSISRFAQLERQDDDFHAYQISMRFLIEGTARNPDELDQGGYAEDSNPEFWELNDDEVANAREVEALKTSVTTALEQWISHFTLLGLVRADLTGWANDEPALDNQVGPTFFLVHRADCDDLQPTTLAEFTPVTIELPARGGAFLTFQAEAIPTNATMLYDAIRRGGSYVGQWGGEATPGLAPSPDESRDDWLARVSLPRPLLARLMERQRRSKGNIRLFRAAGAASGQVAKARPIEWIIPGLIPRGYVSLLVGTKQAGKSTLLGELLAVVDSECETPRSVLGTEISARGASAFVSGEDGYDFVASRNAYYEPVHGEAQGFVFITAEMPWAEVLKLLYEIPRGTVVVIGIDGLRAVMPGDEDSSGAISQFFDELNALAQYHNCAIVLIHHLSKAAVRSLSGMLQAVRGSGAITDRVRMAIGMIYRGSNIVEIGIIKHNIPPSETVWGEVNVGRLFRRDASTLTLEPVEAFARGAADGAAGSSSDRTSDAILEAIEHFNKLGVVLRRTGRHELFEQRPPQLAGLSRSTIRDGVGSLLAAGRIVDGPDGLQVAAAAPPAAAK